MTRHEQRSATGPRHRRARAMVGVAWSLAAAGVILTLHYSAGLASLGLHDLLRRLFYLPVIAAAIAGGMWGGLLTAGLIAAGYIPHLGQLALAGDRVLDHALELLLLPIVGALVGRFVDSSRRARAVAAERGRLAALGEVGLAVMAQVEGPLAAIEGQAESLGLLAHRSRDVAVRFAAEIIQDESARVRRFLADLHGLDRSGGRRASRVELSALVLGVVADLSVGRVAATRLSSGSHDTPIAILADGRVVAHALRTLLRALLEALPPSGRLDVQLKADSRIACVEVRASLPSHVPPQFDRDLGAVFGAGAGEYDFDQALCIHLLASEGGRVETRRPSEHELLVRLRFERQPGRELERTRSTERLTTVRVSARPEPA